MNAESPCTYYLYTRCKDYWKAQMCVCFFGKQSSLRQKGGAKMNYAMIRNVVVVVVYDSPEQKPAR